jgi:hypothetical protein
MGGKMDGWSSITGFEEEETDVLWSKIETDESTIASRFGLWIFDAAFCFPSPMPSTTASRFSLWIYTCKKKILPHEQKPDESGA